MKLKDVLQSINEIVEKKPEMLDYDFVCVSSNGKGEHADIPIKNISHDDKFKIVAIEIASLSLIGVIAMQNLMERKLAEEMPTGTIN